MKTLLVTCSMVLFFSIYSNAQNEEMNWREIPCNDSTEYTVTDYPVRLTNNKKDLQKSLAEAVLIYPEDKFLSDSYTFSVRVDCNGNALEATLLRSNGSNKLKKRLEKQILEECIWMPAIHMDLRVRSFYLMYVIVENGKCKIIEVKRPNPPLIEM